MAIKKMDRRETDAFMAEEEKSHRSSQKQTSGTATATATATSPSSSTSLHIASITEEDEDDNVSDTSGSVHETVSRAPFSMPQGGSESESNTGE